MLCALSKPGRRQIQCLTWDTEHSLMNSSYPLQAMNPLSHPIVASLVSSLMACTRLAWPPFPCLSSPTSLLGPQFVNVFLTCKPGCSQSHIYLVKVCSSTAAQGTVGRRVGPARTALCPRYPEIGRKAGGRKEATDENDFSRC